MTSLATNILVCERKSREPNQKAVLPLYIRTPDSVELVCVTIASVDRLVKRLGSGLFFSQADLDASMLTREIRVRFCRGPDGIHTGAPRQRLNDFLTAWVADLLVREF